MSSPHLHAFESLRLWTFHQLTRELDFPRWLTLLLSAKRSQRVKLTSRVCFTDLQFLYLNKDWLPWCWLLAISGPGICSLLLGFSETISLVWSLLWWSARWWGPIWVQGATLSRARAWAANAGEDGLHKQHDAVGFPKHSDEILFKCNTFWLC